MMGVSMNACNPMFQRAVTRAAGRRLRALIRDRGGAAAVTIALSFTGVAGLAGIGAETASWYYTQRSMQGAADAAAHTAATALMQLGNSDVAKAAAKVEACSVARNFNFTCDTATNVHIPPTSGTHAGSTDAVEVDLSQPMQMMFSGMFMSTAPTVSTRSVAMAAANTSPPCVFAMDKNSETGMSTNGTPALNLTGCSLYVNAAGTNALSMGGGTITTPAAYIVGSNTGTGLNTPTPQDTHNGVPPHNDPYGSVANVTSVPPSPTCGSQNNDHVSGNRTETWCKDHANGTFVFTNGVQVDGGSTLNLCPGTYYVNGGTVNLQGGATLNAPPTANTTPPMSSTLCGTNTTGGVTIILMNSTTGGNPANLNFTANSTANLTAPSSGTYSGLAIFQARTTCSGNSNTCANSLDGGGTQNIQGAIYVPNNAVDFQGGASSGALAATCTQLFAYKINFSGTSNLSTSCASAGTATVYVNSSQLVE
jgi:Flp pilus assembly protein TadG